MTDEEKKAAEKAEAASEAAKAEAAKAEAAKAEAAKAEAAKAEAAKAKRYRVVNRNYSKFYDIHSKTQFDSELDRASGCHIAVAHVDEATARSLHERKNAGFEVEGLDGAENA